MKKNLIKFGFFLIILAAVLSVNSHMIVFAQGASTRVPIIPEGVTEELKLPHPEGGDEEKALTEQLLPGITRTVIAAAGGLALLFIIIGGIQMLTAYGNDEKITAAKKTMTFAVVGLLIAILSYAIVSIISAIDISPKPPRTSP
jgi:hypothetical protein